MPLPLITDHCSLGTSLRVMATQTAATEKSGCSIDAMLDGGTCGACQ